MMQTRELVQNYFDRVWNQGDHGAEEALVDERYRGHWLIRGMPLREGLAGHRGWLTSIRTGLPDLIYTVEQLVVEGDRACARVRLEGTHTGVLNGLAATHRRVSVDQVFLFEFKDRVLVAETVGFDRNSFLEQLKPGA